MESDHLAHFAVRLQCLWTFTLPTSIFGVVRATNNREAASIQAYSECGVDCGGAAQMLQTCQATRLYMLAPPSVRRTESNFYSLLSEGAQRTGTWGWQCFFSQNHPLPEQLGRSSLRCTQLANLCYSCCVQEQEMLEEAKNTAVHSWDAMKGSDSFITTLIVIVRRTQD